MFEFGLLIALLVAAGWALYKLAGADPPAEPPWLATRDTATRDALFRRAGWTKVPGAALGPAPPAYNRPPDVEVAPDQQILPPPREIEGVNNE